MSAPARAEDIVRKVQDSAAPAVPPSQDDGAVGAPASTLPVPTPIETPFFADAVSSGKLPPVAERLPAAPRVVDLPAMGRRTGQPGGTWRMLMSDQRDLRFMTVFSYTRLVVFDEKLNLVPDILQSLDNQDDEVFTLHLRPGHRWSDGQPFTSEDFEYYWNDFANDKKLSPSGPPLALIANGKPPKFEVLDKETVRYTWADPNPGFLPAIASSNPTFIFMPKHYLMQFHQKYADKDELAKLVKAAKVSGWVALHERKSRQYRVDNPDLPTLDPWRNTTYAPAEQFRFERNPYFHRVDSAGHQLPYFDGATMTLGTPTLIPAKTAAGRRRHPGALPQLRGLHLPQGRRKGPPLRGAAVGRRARRLRGAVSQPQRQGHGVADAEPRRPLPPRPVTGINRPDINNVLFFGLARPSGDTVLPQSPLFKPELAQAYATYDAARPTRCSTRRGCRSGTRTARACCRTGAVPRSRSRPSARTRSSPTSWSSWAATGRSSASAPTSTRPTSTSSASASPAATR